MINPVVVAQIGARRRYAIPDALHEAGLLKEFYTDAYAPSILSSMMRVVPPSFMPRKIQRAMGRKATHTPRNKITCIHYDKSTTNGSHLKPSIQFSAAVAKRLPERPFTSYTFNSAGLKIITATRNRGLHAVHDQTLAPRKVIDELMERELELFPDWSATHQQQPDSEVFFERETHELDACSHIICGSEWVKATTLAACDLPPEKITVIPPCIHPSPDPLARRTSRPAKTPLRVLFAGTLSLRKGIQHLHEAVRNWDGPELSVTAIGPHALPNRLLTSLSSTIKLLPALPYYKLQQVFNRYDVLVLPTLAEGSARICLEAMAAGLPVITTPNAGSLVRDQVDGFIVPAGETEPLARILNKLASDPDQTIELGEHASEQARQNTLETYCQSLINLLHSVQEESG